MKSAGLLNRDAADEPQRCEVAYGNGQIYIYVQDQLLIWKVSKILSCAYSGGSSLILNNSIPAQKLECEGEVAAAIYKSWLNKDEPAEKSGNFGFKHLAMIAVAGIFITGLFVFLFYSALPSVAERSASWIPKELEIKIGEQLAEIYREEHRDDNSDSVDFFLAKFVSRLKLNTDYPIRVRLIRSDEINAFALPGGNIFIYSGLLSKMASHEELVALLGHEISHVTKRHSLKSIMSRAAAGVLISAVFGDTGSMSSWLLSKAGEFKQLEYSRELETEADKAGLVFMSENNVDPSGMLRLLELLKDESAETPELMKYLSSHPDVEERIHNVRSGGVFKKIFESDPELDKAFRSVKLFLP